MVLLFKILNRKCSCPLIFRNFLSKIFRKSKMGYAPHHLASQGAGCRSCRKRQFGKKSPRGEALKWLNIFASLCASTMRQGEGTKRLTIFADFCNSKNRVKERRAKKRAPLIRRRTATPFPPEGEGLNKEKLIFDLYRLADARHFPRRGKQGA